MSRYASEITKLTTAAQPRPAVTSPSHRQTSTQPSTSFGPIKYLHHLNHPLQIPFFATLANYIRQEMVVSLETTTTIERKRTGNNDQSRVLV
jgi:hypothetical protein